MSQTALNVPDVSRGHCEQSIASTSGDLAGVEQVAVDILGKQVRVAYDPKRANLDRVTPVLAEEGYLGTAASPAGEPDTSTTAVPVACCSCSPVG